MTQDYNYWKDRNPDDTQKDWKIDGSWLEGYEKSVSHPHRKLVVKSLRGMESILEVGSSCGPNLLALSRKHPEARLFGVDANQDAVNSAARLIPSAGVSQGDIIKGLPFKDGSFDAVLADAVLMYVNPHEILDVMSEMDRVSSKRIVVVDRFANARLGVDTGYIWHRNYGQLLQEMGYKVRKIKLTQETWPHSRGWATHGYVWVGNRI